MSTSTELHLSQPYKFAQRAFAVALQGRVARAGALPRGSSREQGALLSALVGHAPKTIYQYV